MAQVENRRRFFLSTGATALAATVGSKFLPQAQGDETDNTAPAKRLRVVPLSTIDDPWIDRLKVTMRPPERGMSLLIFDLRFQG